MGLTNNLGKLSSIITSTGSAVGIGTSSPSANLQLSGYTSGLPASSGSAQRGGFRIANSSNIGFDFGTVAAGQAWMQVSDVNNYASNFALLLNPNGGNVGIGTTNPVAKLQVYGIETSPSLTSNTGIFTVNSTSTVQLNIGGNNSSPYPIWLQTRDTSGGSNAYPLLLNPLGGNVGIGTSSPTALGTGYTTLDVRGSSGGGINMGNATYSGYIYCDTEFRLQSSNSAITFLPSGSEKMRITSAGNVGIGTSSPLAYSGYTSLTIGNNASGSIGLLKFRSTYNSGDGAEIYQTTSGNLNFNINGSLGAMSITSSGAVLTPARPAFRAYYSVNGFWNLNTNDLFNFDSTEYNIGSCFNTSNGSFTAPVAGVYQFNFYAIVYGAITNGAIAFRRNGVPPTSGHNVHFSPTQAGAWSNVVYTTSIYLSAGDYVQMYNTGGYTQYHGKDWSSFSGYLVG